MNLLILCLVAISCCASAYAKKCNPSVHPPEPSSGCCGVATYDLNKKIPGRFADIDQYPWMGLLEFKKGNKTYLICGAFLISSRYALSAAQCFSAASKNAGTPTNVRLGDYDITNEGPDCVGEDSEISCNDGALRVPIEEVIKHPGYRRTKKNRRQNDIALIRLKQSAPFTEFIRPICLPASDITLAQPLPLLTLAGWGSVNKTYTLSNTLHHHLDLPLVDSDTCISAFNHTRIAESLGDGQMCAGGEKDKDACNGDSGNPLMHVTKEEHSDTFEVAGIVSYGANPCGQVGKPGVYTKVFAYKDWILENIVD